MNQKNLSSKFNRLIDLTLRVIPTIALMLLASQLLYGIGKAFAAAPTITATKADSLINDVNGNSLANMGDTLRYTVTIQNPTVSDVTSAAFSDTLDNNTTLAPISGNSFKSTPIARNDGGYSTVGNVQLTVPVGSSVLLNDNDPDGGTITLTTTTTTSTNGGNVVLAANGSFTYNPAPGYSGTDTFTYTVQDSDSNTDTAIVSITVGQVVWFINNAVGGPGDGRFASPFNSISNFNSLAADDAGDYIFIYQGSGAYSGTLTLLNTQQLIGHSLGLVITPNLSISSGSRPTISNVALGSGNTVKGLNINTSSGTALSGASIGTLTINTISVTNSGGAGLNLSNGAITATFDSISSNGGVNGVNLSEVTGSFVMNGGTITNSTDHGFNISNTTGTMSTLTLTNSTFSNAPFGMNGINIAAPSGNAVFTTVNITNNTFTNNGGTALKASIQGTSSIGKIDIGSNTLNGNPTGVDLATNGTASMDFDVHNNSTMTGKRTQVNIAALDTVPNNGSGPTMEGYIRNNTMTLDPTDVGIATWVVSDGDGNITVDINNNSITGFGDSGIDVESRGGTGDVHARIVNNTASTTAAFPLAGMFLRSGNAAPGETSLLCVNATGNNMTVGAAAVAHYYLDRFTPATTVFQIQGLTGSTPSDAETRMLAVNTVSGAGSGALAEPGTYTAATCQTVSFAAVPSALEFVQEPQADIASVSASSNFDLGQTFATIKEQTVNWMRDAISTFGVSTAYASGETLNVTLGTLNPGQQVTIIFDATINNPVSSTQACNQGTLTATGPISVLTDDTSVGGLTDPTCTPIDRPDAIVNSINRQTPSTTPTNAASVVWRVTFDTPISGLTSSNFTLANTGLAAPSITTVSAVTASPATQWDVTVNTGTGDGTLGLNLTNDAALSHDLFVPPGPPNLLPFTGQTYTIDKTAPTVSSILRKPASTNPTNADVLVFRVTFNEPVTTVGASSFVDTGTTTPVSSSVSSITPNLVYDFTVDGATDGGDLSSLNGTVGLNIASSPTIKDLAGNTLQVLEPTPVSNDETFTLDNTAPIVNTFTATSPSASLNIPITAFTASDGVGVTGYLITESSTPPLAGAAGWTGAAPATYTVASSGSYTLYPWAKDGVGNVSAVFGSPATVIVDTAAPTVNTFTATSPSGLIIPITAFTASDGVGVTGYLITESSTPPLAGAAGWTGTAPTTYTVASNGAYTLYPWAKDGAGNVSPVFGTPANVTVDGIAPTVNTFTATSPSGFIISITAFTASDATGVTGYLITQSSTPPLAGAAGWAGAAPATYTVASDGSYTLYPWAKDAAGNVSSVFGTPAAVIVDTAAPVVNTFTATSPSASLNIPITAFTASDGVGVTGYLITQSSTPPLAGAAGWTGAAPATYTVASNGSYTLYPWAKDGVGNVSPVFGSPASVVVDTAKPTVNTFTATSPSSSLNIPITAFTASDNVAVSGYLITQSSTPPLAGAAGWTGAAPATYTVASDGSYTLYPWAKDAAGNVSLVFGSPASVSVDSTAPGTSITSTLPSNPTNNNTANFDFTGTDNITPPGSLTFECKLDSGLFTSCTSTQTYNSLSNASHTFQVRAKDAAGNVDSSPASYTWTVDTVSPSVVVSSLTTSPTNISPILVTITFNESVTGFTPSIAAGDIIITNGTDSNPLGSGTTYTFNLSPIAQGPVTVRVPSGSASDAATNLNSVSNTLSITYDTTAPTVNTFTAPPSSTTLNIPITAFTASDTVGVTGYKITTNASQPVAGAAGWTGIAPAVYTVASDGSYILYPWAKDAAGNVSALFGTPRTVVVDTSVTPPSNPIFTDVPFNHWANGYVERLYKYGVTSGCGTNPLIYCPNGKATRAEMAIFILRAKHNTPFVSYTPPPVGTSTGFSDVPVGSFADAWIKQLAAEGITLGCGGGNYCPNAPITRAEMAIFLLRAKHGSAYNPPAATGTVFGDVSANSFAAAWIEQLKVEGIATGYSDGKYYPNNSVSRAEMAVFLVKAFGLP